MDREKFKSIFIVPENKSKQLMTTNSSSNDIINSFKSGKLTNEGFAQTIEGLRNEASIRSLEQEYVQSGLLDDSGTLEKIKEQIYSLWMKILVILSTFGLLGADDEENTNLDYESVSNLIEKIEITTVKDMLNSMLQNTQTMISITEDDLFQGEEKNIELLKQKRDYTLNRKNHFSKILFNLPLPKDLYELDPKLIEQYIPLYTDTRKKKLILEKSYNAIDAYITSYEHLLNIENEVSQLKLEIQYITDKEKNNFKFSDTENIVLTSLEKIQLDELIQEKTKYVRESLSTIQEDKKELIKNKINNKLTLLGIDQTRLLHTKNNENDEFIYVKKTGGQDDYCKVSVDYQTGVFIITPLSNPEIVNILQQQNSKRRNEIITIFQSYGSDKQGDMLLSEWNEQQIKFTDSTNGQIILNVDGTMQFPKLGINYIKLFSGLENETVEWEGDIPKQFVSLDEITNILDENKYGILTEAEYFLSIFGKDSREISNNLDIFFEKESCNGFWNYTYKTVMNKENKYLCFGEDHENNNNVQVIVWNSDLCVARIEKLSKKNLFSFLIYKK